MAGAGFVVQVEGIEELIARLDRAASSAVLRAAMQASCDLVQRQLAVYPPARSGSQYRRTGTLGRRWTTKVTGAGYDVEGVVGNNTAYGPYVMDWHDQAWMHVGVWPIAQDVAGQAENEIAAIFEDAVSAALG
jgi:hypothetical protein